MTEDADAAHHPAGRADILLTADSRFALGVWVAVWTTSRHWKGDQPPRFHLVTSDPDAAGTRKLEELARSQQISLTVHPARLDAVKGLPVGHYPALAYIRLLMPELMPEISRFIYLDADILVRASLHSLLDEVPLSAALGGVRDFGVYSLRQGLPFLRAVDPAAAYSNSGIMVVNCQTWRRERITERVLKFLGEHGPHLTFPDQDGINGVLQGQFHQLDFAWNVQPGAVSFYDRTGWPDDRCELKARRDDLLANPKVVHFIGAAKPWNDGLRIPYAGEYRDAIFESGWIDPKWKFPWKLRWLAGAAWRTAKRRFKR